MPAFGGKAMKPRRPLKSSIVKRSIIIGGRKTSISLEAEFWGALKEIVKERGTTLQELVTSIKAERREANLSSAVRVFLLRHCQDQAERAMLARAQMKEPQTNEAPHD
jgi:predicted DNA-binding ribbon-helix-helix protein